MEQSPAFSHISQHSSKERLGDWRAMFLVIALVEISSTRLVITEWVPFLYFTQTTGLAGVILGLALGYSYFSRKAVVRLSIGYTLILLPFQLLNAMERTDWVWTDIATLFTRLFTSLGQFIKGQPVYDQLFFTSLVTLGYWAIGLCAGYWLTRHKDFINTILPAGLAMLIIQAFDPVEPNRIWGLAVYIFVALLLLGRMYFLVNHFFWTKTNFLLTTESTNDLERGALVVAALTVFIAWSMPGWITNIKPAAKAWHSFSTPILERLSDAVIALDSPYGTTNKSGDFYASELSLGQQAATGDNPVFYVEVKQTDFTPVRNYWKGRDYDLYINGHWTNVSNSSADFSPQTDDISLEYPDARNEMEFTFTNNFQTESLLYAPAETVWVSRESSFQSTPISAGIKDITAWFAVPSLSSGNKYTVRALIADPSIEELRATGTEYPGWVKEKYLQVPENIAPQLRDLAIQITAPYDTVYDKTQAITIYLRQTIQYDKAITSTPPENKDPVLWVLFDYKKGFCMYYASAETLMLRSIGIPARMAVGFAEGTFDEIQERYVVTYDNAHAWPEVYFPGIGWVEFEPTGNQAPISRPETKNNPPSEAPNPALAENLPFPLATLQPEQPLLPDGASVSSKINSESLYGKYLIYLLAIFALVFSLFMIRRYTPGERLPVYLAGRYARSGNIPPPWLDRWLRWTKLSPIERTFQAINLSLFWLGCPQPVHVTSHERAKALIERLPSAKDQTLKLLDAYQITMYTPRTGNVTSARRSAIIILLKTGQHRIKETLQFLDYRYNQLR